jgi:hypothetical protein
MSFTPISNTPPQYEENGIAASGYYIKLYESGTTTPTAMATDSTGATLLDKCQLNTEGYPINGSGAVFIPHINVKYKIALFRNGADANANDLNSAAWDVDGLFPYFTDSSIGTDFDQIPLNTDIVYPIANVTALRALTGITVGQSFYLESYSADRIGGGPLICTKTLGTEVDNGGTLFVVDGVVIERPKTGSVTAEMFGGIPDFNLALGTGTDNQAVIQSVNQYCLSSGEEFLLTGRFGIGSAVVQRAITMSGISPEVSGIYALNDGHRILNADSGDTGGTCLISDLTIHGYADRNTTQGSDQDALVDISPFDQCTFDNVELAWGRQIGFKSRATVTKALNCYVHHMLRDGINLTDSKHKTIDNCRIEFIADDSIACHLPTITPLNTFVYAETIVTNNQLFNCNGIKVLSNTATITGNRGQMIFGYGVNVGFDSTPGFEEGFIDKKLVTISDNNFENILNLDVITASNLGAGIWIQSDINPVTATGIVPGNPNASGVFTDDLPYLNEFGETAPHLGIKGMVINGNSFIQSWTGGATISDFGLGEAWTVNGFEDVALAGSLGKDGNSVFGYRFDTSMKGVVLNMGTTYGVTAGLRLQSIEDVRDCAIHLGSMSRISSRAISIGLTTSPLECQNVVISGGIVNLDPLGENSDHNADGSWSNTGTTNGIFFESNNVNGWVITNVSLSNVKRITQGVTKTELRDNILYQEPGKGIGVPADRIDQIRIYTDSDPTSATYGTILQGSLDSVNTLPTTGSYFVGQTISRLSPQTTDSQFGGKRVSEYIRLTDGAGAVAGTDWGAVAITLT